MAAGFLLKELERVEKKKILVIGPGMEIGGVEKSLLGLLDSIDYSENEVDLFLYSHSGELMQYINPNVNLLPEEPLYALVYKPIAQIFKTGHLYAGTVRLFSKVLGAIRAPFTKKTSISLDLCRKFFTKHVGSLEKKYDIAISFFIPHFFVLDRVNAKMKIGWVHTDYRSKFVSQDTKFYLPMYKRLDYIACISSGVKESFDFIYPECSNKSVVIENISSKRLIEEQSEEYSPSDSFSAAYNLLTVGRYDPDKNFDRIPYMCKSIREKGIDANWYIIGYGLKEVETKIREAITAYHMEDHVFLLGKKSNPYPYIRACDVFVLPSSDEGKSVVVTEAQILERPVVITNYPTAKNQLLDGVNGIISPLDFGACAETISALLLDKQKRGELSENCKNTDFSNSCEVNKIFKLFSDEVAK